MRGKQTNKQNDKWEKINKNKTKHPHTHKY